MKTFKNIFWKEWFYENNSWPWKSR
jgi:hypothetical protein